MSRRAEQLANRLERGAAPLTIESHALRHNGHYLTTIQNDFLG